MSNGYHFRKTNILIGQTHALPYRDGKPYGYHFTWMIYPLNYALMRELDQEVRDEYGKIMSIGEFETDIIVKAKSCSVENPPG